MAFQKLKYIIIIAFGIAAVWMAYLMPKVNVNYNSLEYLPADSKTKQAFEALETDFGNTGSLFIMVEGIHDENGLAQVSQLLMVDGVRGLEYRKNGDKFLFSLVLNYNDYQEESSLIIHNIISVLDENHYTYYLNGQSYLTYTFHQTLNTQMAGILFLLIPFIIVIMLCFNSSFFEPFLFVTIIGISVVLNMGSNAFLPNVSYLTHNIVAVIQYAVCMDYSIILLRRYDDCKKETPNDAGKALTKAWHSSLVPIMSSSLTTVAGFIAIMFMRYQIGFDIGLILAKGVILALITNLFLFPCLILVFDKVLEKARHRSVFSILSSLWKRQGQNNIPLFGKVSYATRYLTPILALAIIGGCFIIQRNNDFIYSENSTTKDIPEITDNDDRIKAYFDLGSQAVLLLPKDYDSSVLISMLEDYQPDGASCLSGIYALDHQLSLPELKALVNLDVSDEQLGFLYQLINRNSEKETISFRELSAFLATLGAFSAQQTSEAMAVFLQPFVAIRPEDLAMLYEMEEKTEMSASEILALLQTGFDATEIKTLLSSIARPEDLEVILPEGEGTMTIPEVIAAFYQYVTTPYDTSEMATILGGMVTLSELDNLYLAMNATKLSIKDVADFLTRPLGVNEMAGIITDMDQTTVTYVYQMMGLDNALVDQKTTISNFILYVQNNLSTLVTEEQQLVLQATLEKMVILESYQKNIGTLEEIMPVMVQFDAFNPEFISVIGEIDPSLIEARFIGNHYQRLVLSINLPEEGETSFRYYQGLEDIVRSEVSDYHIIARTSAVDEIRSTSDDDYFLTSIVSIVMVFIIIMISFRSAIIPLVLVLIIQGAVFINMAIPALSGEPLIFMGYIIVSCLQLGATIDYAILTTHRYLDNRKTLDKKSAMFKTIDEASGSILTSGLILTVAGFILSFVSKIPVIASMGRLVGFAGGISMSLVLIVLPQILVVFDKAFVKSEKLVQ